MAILISIRPEWVEKILNGEKTIEIRKTMPKRELPCKVYIYCTKPKKWYKFSNWGATSDELLWKTPKKIKMCNGFEFWADDIEYCRLNGRIVAEFTLDSIDVLVDVGGGIHYCDSDNNLLKIEDLLKQSCLTDEQIYDYLGESQTNKGYYNDGYAWHISNLEIYDKPKELSEFVKPCPTIYDCCCCKYWENSDCNKEKITRPPQGWCYCEEI